MKISSLALDNPVILAPMAGISDLPYRLTMKRFGAALVFTEMVSANGLFHGGSGTGELLRTVPEERPLGVQLFGDDPQRLAEAARRVEETADVIDLNCGCPVRKVVGSGAGSALLRDPGKIARIIAAVRRATSRPLTIKLRSGWDATSRNFLEIARLAVAEGIDAMTLHPRTRSQMFGGRADWDDIAALKHAVPVPVIASGDLFTAEDATEVLARTGCDAVMVARGGYGNPWLIRQSLDRLAGNPACHPTGEERLTVARGHLDLFLDTYGPARTLAHMRKHLCWYTHGLPGAAVFRQKVNQARSVAELYDLLAGFEAAA
ncbi:MAG: tRNA dihydrouridine synthase DusB [Deltaproteobacteria bacterium]|nr:MAG: tRNA dihydrouridine synthase DusB [Deltaproteobacteria bacterium]